MTPIELARERVKGYRHFQESPDDGFDAKRRALKAKGIRILSDRDRRSFGDGDLGIEGEDRVRLVIIPNPRSNSAERREFRQAVHAAGGLYYFGPDEFIGRHGLPIVDEQTEAIEVSFVAGFENSILSCAFVAGADIVDSRVLGFIAAGSGELSESAKRFGKLNKYQRSQSVPRHRFGVDRTPRGLLEAK